MSQRNSTVQELAESSAEDSAVVRRPPFLSAASGPRLGLASGSSRACPPKIIVVPYIPRLIASAFFLRFHHYDVSVWFDRTRLRAFLQKIDTTARVPTLWLLVKKDIVLASLTLRKHEEEKNFIEVVDGRIKDSRGRW